MNINIFRLILVTLFPMKIMHRSIWLPLQFISIFLCLFHSFVNADVGCPRLPSGIELVCGKACCLSHQGENQGYYCCEPDNPNVIRSVVYKEAYHPSAGRHERYTSAYPANFQIDYSLLLIGLIVSVLLSVILSFICCLLCNGCWLHRRRNPHMYENVNERGEGRDGFYPICCGFGIPMGTVVFSTHPPQFRDEMYGGSSVSGGGGRVRFNDDGTPKGVLKNGNGGERYH